jgi:hypothetical protein
MKDTEFISELFVIVIAGIQDQQKSLDRFYADNDVTFAHKSRHLARFRQVIASLRTLDDIFSATRFAKKADFYGLFAAVRRLTRQDNEPVDLSSAIPALRRLSEELEDDPQALVGIARDYYGTVIEGPNKILFNLIQQAIGD